jgi:hypothetical protein
MGAIVTTCRVCGKDFEPTTPSVRAGRWQQCPACMSKPAPEPETRCQGCGRPLTTTGRTWCYRCLTGESGL